MKKLSLRIKATGFFGVLTLSALVCDLVFESTGSTLLFLSTLLIFVFTRYVIVTYEELLNDFRENKQTLLDKIRQEENYLRNANEFELVKHFKESSRLYWNGMVLSHGNYKLDISPQLARSVREIHLSDLKADLKGLKTPGPFLTRIHRFFEWMFASSSIPDLSDINQAL